jgi:polysaccharide biosynthesis protein PslH
VKPSEARQNIKSDENPSRLRILFVTANLPIPVRAGSAQRTNLIIGALRELGTVDLFTLDGEWAKKNLESEGFSVAGNGKIDNLPWLQFFGRAGHRYIYALKSVARVLFPKSVRYRAVSRCADELRRVFTYGKYDLVIGRYLGPSARAGVHLLSPAIIDVDDLESQKVRSWIATLPFRKLLNPFAEPFLRRMEHVERGILSGIDRTWVAADEDNQTISTDNIDVIPNIPFLQGALLGQSQDKGPILFVGSLDYRINVNAVSRFLVSIWPNLVLYDNKLRLRIVGGGLSAKVKSKWEKIKGVQVLGFVADLKEEYREASLSIIPIWEGGGTKIKLLESLSFQRTSVVARPSMRGYTDILKNGESLRVADTEQEFAKYVLELLESPEQRRALEIHGNIIVNQHFGQKILKEKIQKSIRLVTSRKHIPDQKAYMS